MNYFIDRSYKTSLGIANAVLVTLGMGLLIQTVGELTQLAFLIKIGAVGKTMLIPGLGIGIAICLGANTLVVISAAASAIIGGGGIIALSNGNLAISGGEPVGAILAAIVSIWLGKRITGKTKLDMILIPAVALLAGGLSGLLFSQMMSPLLVTISRFITSLVANSPIISSMVIAAIFGILILSPASSAALAIALQLDATASAAALIGCSVQFASFAVLSYQDNARGAFLAQLFITPKLQTANIIRKPSLMIVPLLTTLVAGPIGIFVLHLQATAEIAGMGLCAFVAPLYLAHQVGIWKLGGFIAVAVIFPAIVAFVARAYLLRKRKLCPGDLKVELK